ncbi:MAG TPA: hypothetical protein D7H81_03985 [Candidatus Poseidoniales archaeon]|nr:MAG TPA: hypothetical protein D7H81_03985 [Candidatus Poseidoniales archaeon]
MPRPFTGDLMATNLFGTDGIRGQVNANIQNEKIALEALRENREISPPIFRLIGEALGRCCEVESGQQLRAVVGWDDRPSNTLLAEYLTVGLNLAGFEVTHIGVCATPGLHYATLMLEADFGCMITASHNPVADSGLKIFTKYGYKTLPDFEVELSRNAISLSREDREIDHIERERLAIPATQHYSSDWSITNHSAWLTERYSGLAQMLGKQLSSASNISRPLLVDSSRGSNKHWLVNWLIDRGIAALEVSDSAPCLNENCGAGDFLPTQEWTFADAKRSSHRLISQLSSCQPGTLVGAALDGDGDRCLLIESTTTGFRVIDGDRIADAFINCFSQAGYDWHLAASIESDLSLTTNLDRFPQPIKTSETAVGDRWLSVSLSNGIVDEYLVEESLPQLIGVEDSGHVVLPSPHPKLDQNWSLVGDGAMSLVVYLLSTTNLNEATLMKRGWKCRQSVSEVDRSKWDGKNQLSNTVESTFREYLGNTYDIDNWARTVVDGEENLMLITCTLSGAKLSLGVRNSGTQAKISVSARLEQGGDSSGIQRSIDAVCDILAAQMVSR